MSWSALGRGLKRGGLRAWTLVRDTYERYDDQRGDLLAAAFSFYSLLSIAPLAVIAVTIAGLFVDPAEARAALLRGVERASGRDIADVVVRGLEAAQSQRVGIGAAIALFLLLWAASRLFTVLQEGLNQIWGVQPTPAGSVLVSLRRVALKRLVSFAMVIGCGALLLASLVLQTTMTSVSTSLLAHLGLDGLQGRLAFVQQLGLSLLALTVAFALVFRMLPDAYVQWRAAWIGGVVTAVMVLLGTVLLSLYLSKIAPNWLQGAVGSIAAFVIWSYYLAQVFLLGASLTRVRATCHGERLEPEPHAELVT
jgi:membrane protein